MPIKSFKKASRYWHTLRHLRPVQIYGRAWFRVYRPKPDTGTAPELRKANGTWTQPITRPAMMLGPNEFRFLNQQGSLEKAADWNSEGQAKLWLYNLHYFDDLNAIDAGNRRDWHCALIDRWIAENPAPLGNGWEPYPLSLRIVNWIKWVLAGNELEAEWQQSLTVQVRFLARRLEWHLLGNHLFANAKALVFAGLFFDGPEADRWLSKGLTILNREISEQILPDGGHFELSPMYHSIILEDMLDLINVANTFGDRVSSSTTGIWLQAAQRMRDWLAVMCHPDGNISFFNDATFKIASEPRLIDDYAERLGLASVNPPGQGVTHLKDSGYIRVELGELVALIDVGQIGPDYIPGHAHADTLSFEMSLSGSRVIVNSGISQYGTGPERLYQRSTKAHSTLEVDEQNSSEVWGGFRVARRARPASLNIIAESDKIIIRCAHDGYHRLKGRVTHQREWRFRDGSMEIVDDVDGTYDKAVARYYLHPDIVPAIEEATGVLSISDIEKLRWRIKGGEHSLQDIGWYPEFGESVPTNCLTFRLSTSQGRMIFTW